MVVRTGFLRGSILVMAVLVAIVAPASVCLAAMQYTGASLAGADFTDSHLSSAYGQDASYVSPNANAVNFNWQEHGRIGG